MTKCRKWVVKKYWKYWILDSWYENTAVNLQDLRHVVSQERMIWSLWITMHILIYEYIIKNYINISAAFSGASAYILSMRFPASAYRAAARLFLNRRYLCPWVAKSCLISFFLRIFIAGEPQDAFAVKPLIYIRPGGEHGAEALFHESGNAEGAFAVRQHLAVCPYAVLSLAG